jgi:CO/xanthine dehydrogenase FAD-binding subunit
MQDFQFYTPDSIEEALNFLSEKASACKTIAGGTDLVPSLRKEAIRPAHVMNILEIKELKGIQEEKDRIRIGPTATFTEITNHQTIKGFLPLLEEAASWVGGPTIRNRGTIGGNICTASPAADVLPAVLALEGLLELQSKTAGTRLLPAAEAIEGPYKTRLRPDELLTGILIGKLAPGARHAYEKLARRHAMARAYMSLAVVLVLDGSGAISDLRIVPGAVEAVARRIGPAEKILRGKRPEEPLVREAAEALIGDLSGVWIPDYKLPVLKDVFRRVLMRALNQE